MTLAEQLYNNLVQNHLSNLEGPIPEFGAIVGGEIEVGEKKIEKAQLYTDRLGLNKIDEGIGHLFLNGRYFPLDAVSGSDALLSFAEHCPASLLQHTV